MASVLQALEKNSDFRETAAFSLEKLAVSPTTASFSSENAASTLLLVSQARTRPFVSLTIHFLASSAEISVDSQKDRQTHIPSTVTLATHARGGFKKSARLYD